MMYNHTLQEPGRMYITSDQDLKEARQEGLKTAATTGTFVAAGSLGSNIASNLLLDADGTKSFVNTHMNAKGFKDELGTLFKKPAKIGDAATPSIFEQGGNAVKSTGKFLKNQTPEVGKLLKAVAGSKEGKGALAIAAIAGTLFGAVAGSQAQDARIKAPTDGMMAF